MEAMHVPMRLANRVSKSLAAWTPESLESHVLETPRDASRHNSRRASRAGSRDSSRVGSRRGSPGSSPTRPQRTSADGGRWSVDEGKLGTYELDDEFPHILGFDNMFCEHEDDLFAY